MARSPQGDIPKAIPLLLARNRMVPAWLLEPFSPCSEPAYLPSGLHSLTSRPCLSHLYPPGTEQMC